MSRNKREARIEELRTTLGFDKAHVVGRREVAVGCSQCEAVCINGTPCHETGCPNATKGCKGCGERLPARGGDYCRWFCNGYAEQEA